MEGSRYWTRDIVGPLRNVHLTASSYHHPSWELDQAFAEDSSGLLGGYVWPPRSYPCTFCRREFKCAQALGGHMNVHRREREGARLRNSPDINESNQNPVNEVRKPNPNPNPYLAPSLNKVFVSSSSSSSSSCFLDTKCKNQTAILAPNQKISFCSPEAKAPSCPFVQILNNPDDVKVHGESMNCVFPNQEPALGESKDTVSPKRRKFDLVALDNDEDREVNTVDRTKRARLCDGGTSLPFFFRHLAPSAHNLIRGHHYLHSEVSISRSKSITRGRVRS